MISVELLREALTYDSIDGSFRWRRGNNAVRAGDVAGTLEPRGYRRITISGRSFHAHRLAWLYVTGKWPRPALDHANGNKDDNRIVNLREATVSQNQANSKRRSDNSSGFKGVQIIKGKWVARIKKNGRVTQIGTFRSAADAHAAYAIAAQHNFAEFARAA